MLVVLALPDANMLENLSRKCAKGSIQILPLGDAQARSLGHSPLKVVLNE